MKKNFLQCEFIGHQYFGAKAQKSILSGAGVPLTCICYPTYIKIFPKTSQRKDTDDHILPLEDW